MSQNSKSYTSGVTINVKETLWRLLEQWKGILLWMLVIMLIFSACMMATGRKAAKTETKRQQKEQAVTSEEIIDELAPDQRPLVIVAYRLFNQIQSVADYIQKAPVMQVDPYHVNCFETSWAVQDSDQASTVAQAYMAKLQGDDSCRQLIKSIGIQIPEEQVQESMLLYSQSIDANGVFSWGVYLPEDIDSDTVIAGMKSMIDSLHNELSGSLGSHKIVFLAEDQTVATNTDLVTKQNSVFNSLYNMNSQLTTFKNRFSSQQKEAYQRLLSKKETGQSNPVEKKAAPARVFTPRNIIVGLLLGLFSYLLLYILYLVLANKINDSDELKTMGLHSFGEWYDAKSLKRGLLKDAQIYQIHHKNHLSQEKELEKAAESLINAAEYKNVKTMILIAATALSEGHQPFVEMLLGKLRDAGLAADLTVMGDDLKGRDLAAADGAVPVIVDNQVKKKDMCALLDQCAYYDTPVMGSIYLG